MAVASVWMMRWLLAALACVLIGPAGAAPQPGAPDGLTVEVRRRAVRPGEVLAISVRAEVPLTAMAATLGDRRVPLWRDSATTWRGLAGLDADHPAGPIDLVARGTPTEGPPITRTVTLSVEPATFAERRLSVDPRYVEPPPEARPRIEREGAALRAIYDTTSTERHPTVFVAPVPHRRSSPFGSRSIFNGVPRDRHAGLDFASPAGAIIRAPAAGRVVLVDDLYFTGNTVVVDHGAGVYSVLAHMTRSFVVPGQDVARGTRLGTVGATGRATGAHLHWSVRVGGTRVDPASVLDVLGVGKPAQKRRR
jgi:murein DD-endopeptidase MepM/ murein hydrolase activator NlpD